MMCVHQCAQSGDILTSRNKTKQANCLPQTSFDDVDRGVQLVNGSSETVKTSQLTKLSYFKSNHIYWSG